MSKVKFQKGSNNIRGNYAGKRSSKNRSNGKDSQIDRDMSTESKFPQSQVKSSYNDVSWYAKNDQILRDAASFSYNQPLGSKMPSGELSEMDVTPYGNTTEVNQQQLRCASSVPGVMTLYTAITPGYGKSYNDPLNLAAQNVYSYVRYMNSGSKNYDAPDLMLYLLCMDSAYACWNYYKRIYGLVRSYSQSNWYLPKALVETGCVDFQNIKENLADFRQYLNVTAAKLMSFCTPATMPIFVRHSWIFSNVWSDASQPKAQMYHFVPTYFYRYDEVSNPHGGMLTAVPFAKWEQPSEVFPTHQTPSLKTLTELKDYLDSLINALVYSEDIGVMSGDILKAYGQNNLFKLTPVPEDYMVNPVYNEEVLGQIHNATIVSSVINEDDFKTFSITQDPNTNYLKFTPQVAMDRMNCTSVILNTQKSDVTPADTMINSRLCTTWENEVSTSLRRITSCGTEIVYTAGITYLDNSSPANSLRKPFIYAFKTFPVCSVGGISFEDVETVPEDYDLKRLTLKKVIGDRVLDTMEFFELATLYSNFDWAPILRPKLETVAYTMIAKASAPDSVYAKEEVTRDYYFGGCWGDLSNWTVLSERELSNLHLTAIMSEFDIPQIGSF